MLHNLSPEILFTILYETNTLTPRDIGNVRSTSRRLQEVVDDPYFSERWFGMSSLHTLLSTRTWRGILPCLRFNIKRLRASAPKTAKPTLSSLVPHLSSPFAIPLVEFDLTSLLARPGCTELPPCIANKLTLHKPIRNHVDTTPGLALYTLAVIPPDTPDDAAEATALAVLDYLDCVNAVPNGILEVAAVKAAQNGRSTLVKRLLRYPAFDLYIASGFFLAYMAALGWIDMLEHVRVAERWDPKCGPEVLTSVAAIYNQVDVLNYLIGLDDFVTSPPYLQRALADAAQESALDSLSALLERDDVNPNASSSKALCLAAKVSHSTFLALVNHPKVTLPKTRIRLILQDLVRVSPCSPALLSACMQALLDRPDFDPSAHHQAAIRFAAAHSGPAVSVLLSDPRVDPTVRNNEPLANAVTGNCPASVQALLADPRVDPAADDNSAICQAVRSNSRNVVALLAAHPKVDIHARDDLPLRTAHAHNYKHIIAILDPKGTYSPPQPAPSSAPPPSSSSPSRSSPSASAPDGPPKPAFSVSFTKRSPSTNSSSPFAKALSSKPTTTSQPKSFSVVFKKKSSAPSDPEQ